MIRRLARYGVVFLAFVSLLALAWFRMQPRPENQQLGRFPEKLVYVRSSDDVLSGGAVFSAPQNGSKALAILWFHGWGSNFYNPGYVGVGRALAEQGFTTISANTRMHDIGNVEKHVEGKRIRGGGYWGITSEDARDIRAWIDFAEAQGFGRVVLVGHSAGWSSVARYAGASED